MNYSLLLAAVMSVESANGELSGDGGRAQGRMMCHAIMVREVNRLCGTGHGTSKEYRRKYSEAIFLDFATYLHTKKGFGVALIAQYWNGGEDANRKGKSLQYAVKVEEMYWKLAAAQMEQRKMWLEMEGAK